MDERLVESIEKILAYLESSAQFTVEQAPLVVEEILIYGKIVNPVMSLLGILALLSLLKVFPIICAALEEDDDSAEFAAGLIWTVGATVFGLIGILYYGRLAIMVWVAPRLYVLEYLSSLTR